MPGFIGRNRKLTAKLPNRSISTSAIAIYMPQSVKVGYTQNYDSDTETADNSEYNHLNQPKYNW